MIGSYTYDSCFTSDRMIHTSVEARGVTALIPSVLGGFMKILGDLTSNIGNWEVYEISWVITPIMLGIG